MCGTIKKIATRITEEKSWGNELEIYGEGGKNKEMERQSEVRKLRICLHDCVFPENC